MFCVRINVPSGESTVTIFNLHSCKIYGKISDGKFASDKFELNFNVKLIYGVDI